MIQGLVLIKIFETSQNILEVYLDAEPVRSSMNDASYKDRVKIQFGNLLPDFQLEKMDKLTQDTNELKIYEVENNETSEALQQSKSDSSHMITSSFFYVQIDQSVGVRNSVMCH